jgi:phospholipid transport system substrate-binding protein
VTRRIRAALAAVLIAGGAGAAGLLAGPASHAAEAAAQRAQEQRGPQELMQDIATQMLERLDENRTELRDDPTKVYPIVETILLPHFDTDYAARLVLAQHWRTASPEQRKRFVSALYDALLKTYGGALTDFTADRLKILPFRGDPAATQAIVRTVVTRGNGQQIPVDYRLRKTADGWKAYDVVIEGISYVRNYRNDIGNEVSQRGLDAVIARLEQEGLGTGEPRPLATGS